MGSHPSDHIPILCKYDHSCHDNCLPTIIQQPTLFPITSNSRLLAHRNAWLDYLAVVFCISLDANIRHNHVWKKYHFIVINFFPGINMAVKTSKNNNIGCKRKDLWPVTWRGTLLHASEDHNTRNFGMHENTFMTVYYWSKFASFMSQHNWITTWLSANHEVSCHKWPSLTISCCQGLWFYSICILTYYQYKKEII